MKKMTRDEIKRRLKELEEQEPPAFRPITAMCYFIAGPPLEAVYTCPTCLHRTVYGEDAEWQHKANVEQKIPFMREEMNRSLCAWFELDESEFCRRCSPNVESPVINLKVRIDDDEHAHTIRDVSAEDIEILIEFCKNQRFHSENFGAESPLRDYLERIELLLGVSRNE